MHVLSVVPKIVVISAFVVESNTWMESVKQGFSSADGSTVVWQCMVVSSFSVLSWKKCENVSHPSFVE